MITRADRWLLVFAAGLVAALYGHYWGTAGPAAAISIAASGQPDIELPLVGTQRLHVHGPLGDSVVEIRDGRARFVSSPCRGQQCVHAGWLARAGESAACLPNGVMLSVVGGGARFDSINF